jgi:hypothetical protein
MRRLVRRSGLRVLLILVATITLALSATDAVSSWQDRREVADMTKQLKTVCAGRFLIDLPQDAQVSLSHGSVDGFAITTYASESDQDFLARIKKRELELSQETNQLGKKSLESAQDIRGDGRSGRIFVFNRSSTHVYHGEKKIILDGVSVNAFLRVGGVSWSFISDDYDPKQIGNLPRLIAKMRPVPANQQPVEPGFCVDRGLVADPLTADQGERIVLFAGLPNHPDVGIVFSSMAGTKPGPGLLQRNAENRAKPFAFLKGLFTTLAEGPRTINGLRGEELAVKVREINFATTYGFDWEMGGTEHDVFSPFVSLELQTGINPQAGGPPVQSTLSESALKDLWNTISSSIRVRPVAEPKLAAAAPAHAALGAYARAGETCPETGWWQCSEGGNGIGVLGGQLQYLKKGQRMPQALLLPPQTLWQKVRGLQPSYESNTPTSWKLADKRARPRTHASISLAEATLVARSDHTRPGGAAPALRESGVPLGSYVRTGDPCPASGWWRCDDSHALDGTRWFAQGSLLPAATFRVSPTVFGKRSAPDLIQRRSMWHLVRHAPEAQAARTPGEMRDAAQAGRPPQSPDTAPGVTASEA